MTVLFSKFLLFAVVLIVGASALAQTTGTTTGTGRGTTDNSARSGATTIDTGQGPTTTKSMDTYGIDSSSVRSKSGLSNGALTNTNVPPKRVDGN